jgi:hypothetical protein
LAAVWHEGFDLMKPEDAPRLPTALENVDTGILMDADS